MSKAQHNKLKSNQHGMPLVQQAETDKVRIDKWLWAARFFKTRTLATQQVEGGKVKCNDKRVKPAHLVQVGDTLHIPKGWDEVIVLITALAERRGSSSVAHTLYQETEQSIQKRQERAANRALFRDPAQEIKARPTKRDRRELEDCRWKSSSSSR